MRRWSGSRIFPAGLVLAGCLLAATAALAQPKFEAALDRNTISLGESATLTMTVENGSLQSQLTPPPVAGLQYGGTSTQQQMFFNGSQMTVKNIVTVEVHPAREGKFTIPAMQAVVDGRTLASQPLTLSVVKGNLPAPADKLEAAFLRLAPPTNTIYVGQVIPLEIKCYCQAVSSVQQPQLSSDAFIIGAMSGARAPQVSFRGVPFNSFSFHVPVTPTKTGDLSLGPATWSVNLVTRTDIFGNPFSTTPANPSSDTLVFHVLPIPTNNVPAGFHGAVGEFSLAQFEAAPVTVAVGDPITLKIRITGKGSFDSLSLSAEDLAWRDFKTYPPAKKFESTDPLQIEGSKYFEQVISPENVGVKEIPAFAFSYFDPASGSFHTLTHPAISLHVLPTAATPQPTVAAAATPAQTPPPAQEIVNIKLRPGPVALAGPPLLQRPGFLAWQAVAPLAWICALLWRRQKDHLANNPQLRRRREVARLVQQGLAELSARARAQDAGGFYATVFRLLQEQLGERLDLPASAITEAVLEEARGRGLSEPAETRLRELFHACNQFRYTPEHAAQELPSLLNLNPNLTLNPKPNPFPPAHSAQELAALIPNVKTALHELQKMTPPASAPARKNLVQDVGCLLLLFAAAAGARADSAPDPFDQANKLYEEGHYGPAAAAYEKMTQTGPVPAAVYFNLGNAWFKTGQLGRAICAYRQAQAMAPRDPAVRANLQFARNQPGLGAPAIPGSRWTRWVAFLTLNEWTGLASAVVALFFAVLTVRQIWPAWKKSGAGLTVALAAACVGCLICLALALDARFGAQSSVVIVPETVARLGPDEKAATVFTLHDGAELLVLDRNDGWLEVADAAKHLGWVPQDEVAPAP
jgi:tetratricopeptide (TPR) repeat protein